MNLMKAKLLKIMKLSAIFAIIKNIYIKIIFLYVHVINIFANYA